MPGHPPPTPPAYVAQLERRQEEQQRELDALRSRVGADSLTHQHQLGWLAGWVLAIGKKLSIDPKDVQPVTFKAPHPSLEVREG